MSMKLELYLTLKIPPHLSYIYSIPLTVKSGLTALSVAEGVASVIITSYHILSGLAALGVAFWY
jgi:hypothetical protein